MLQISQHITQLNHPIPDLQGWGGWLAGPELKYFFALGPELIEVDARSILLDKIYGSAMS